MSGIIVPSIELHYTQEESEWPSGGVVMSVDERVFRLENAFATLVRLAASTDERLDQHLSWINQLGAAQVNSEAKIAALADAQIRTEEAIANLTAAQGRTEVALVRLAASQAHTDQRLDALIDVVRKGRNGGPTNP
jgi:hypothetical protein